MIAAFYQHLATLWPLLEQDKAFKPWLTALPPRLAEAMDPDGNGHLPRFSDAIAAARTLPSAHAIHLDRAAVSAEGTLAPAQRDTLEAALKKLMPWRKGPYDLFGILIDTEWRSDAKWDRLVPHLPDLIGKRVLDVGCGSGYHLWRMRGAGAQAVIGIDPTPLFLAQFLVVRTLLGEHPVWFLPLPLEKLPEPQGGAFDVVFSMGVLYHRRSPMDHLLELKAQLKPSGTLVLETLVVPESWGALLVPEDRYAQMKNVWFIPSVAELTRWLHRCGYTHIRCVDQTATTPDEQRTTPWTKGQSLSDFLDPQDPTRTVEGYPAPLRAILLAERPSPVK